MLRVTVFSDPYLMSIHVMQVMSRLFVVIRFKATDVSLSEVGCAPHLKKNSWKNEKYDHWHGIRLAISPSKHFHSKESLQEEKRSIIRCQSEINQHQLFWGKLMPLCQTIQQVLFLEGSNCLLVFSSFSLSARLLGEHSVCAPSSCLGEKWVWWNNTVWMQEEAWDSISKMRKRRPWATKWFAQSQTVRGESRK